MFSFWQKQPKAEPAPEYWLSTRYDIESNTDFHTIMHNTWEPEYGHYTEKVYENVDKTECEKRLSRLLTP